MVLAWDTQIKASQGEHGTTVCTDSLESHGSLLLQVPFFALLFWAAQDCTWVHSSETQTSLWASPASPTGPALVNNPRDTLSWLPEWEGMTHTLCCLEWRPSVSSRDHYTRLVLFSVNSSFLELTWNFVVTFKWLKWTLKLSPPTSAFFTTVLSFGLWLI